MPYKIWFFLRFYLALSKDKTNVIASEATQPLDLTIICKGLLRRCAPRNDVAFVDFAARSSQ